MIAYWTGKQHDDKDDKLIAVSGVKEHADHLRMFSNFSVAKVIGNKSRVTM